MSHSPCIFRFSMLAGIVLLLLASGCAVTTKTDFIKRKQAESTCDLSRLGRNKYFYSGHYQRKLAGSLKMYKKQR